jgi:biotin carboxylase
MENGDGRPRVLLLGTDRYVLEACVRRGVDAVVVYGSKVWDNGLIEVPAPLRPVRVEDQANPEQILAALGRAGLAAAGFDGVHTSDEWALVTATLLAEHFGCPSAGPEVAVRFRDKFLQKAAVAAAGLDTARITVIEDIHDVSAFETLPYPRAVLKPVAGAATSHTTVVSGIEQLREHSRAYAAEHTPQRTFALEEFVGGSEEWCVDGVVFDGELLFAGVGAYHAPCLSAVEQNLPVTVRRFDPDADADAYAKAVPFAARALAALGLRAGVFHMELFHDPATGRLVFGECAARGGGALIHEELQAKFNVSLGAAALACALGRRPDLDVRVRPGAMATSYLLGRPGVLVSCPGARELMERPNVAFARIESPRGTLVADGIGTTNQRVGQVLVTGADREEADARLAEALSWFGERLIVAPHGVPPRRLRDWQREAFPRSDPGDALWR